MNLLFSRILHKVFSLWAVLLGITLLLTVQRANAQVSPPGVRVSEGEPLTLHPENPRYFLFRDKPLALITATEHYGAVFNRPFDFEAYLDDMAEKKITLTRLFLLYRELQTPRNPYSTCKPESPDFIAPWPRTGPGKAIDTHPKYDLSQWNPEYFSRLDRFLRLAEERGIIVELTLLSCTYYDPIWALNPLNAKNNIQEIGICALQDYISLKDEALVEKQLEFVRKIVQVTSHFNNVYYETCNEPIGGFEGFATQQEVNAWQVKIAEVIREECRKTNRELLVFGYPAASTLPEIDLDLAFDTELFDGVNYHPAINGPVTLRGKQFLLGKFMSGEKTLQAVRDFCLLASQESKPCVNDEDNSAASKLNEEGWIANRQRAWVTMMSGGHYDVIDFSITIYTPTGTPAANAKLRTWMGQLSTFFHSLDFIHASTKNDWLNNMPKHVLACTMSVPGVDYAAYLADTREFTTAPTAGRPLTGEVTCSLPDGQYSLAFYSPETGLYSPGIEVQGGKPLKIQLPEFQHDLVLRAKRHK